MNLEIFVSYLQSSGNLPVENIPNLSALKFTTDLLARNISYGVFLFDFLTKEFLYVSDRMKNFLATAPDHWNLPSDTTQDPWHISAIDQQYLASTVNSALLFFQSMEKSRICDHSLFCDFCLHSGNRSILVNLRLCPIQLATNGYVRLSIGFVTPAINHHTGNAIIMVKNLSEAWFLDKVSQKWKKSRFPELTNLEKEILILSRRGLTMEEIAFRVSRSVDTVKACKRKLFNKLGVGNITSAIAFAESFLLF